MLKMNRKKVAALFMIFGILPQSVSFAEEKALINIIWMKLL